MTRRKDMKLNDDGTLTMLLVVPPEEPSESLRDWIREVNHKGVVGRIFTPKYGYVPMCFTAASIINKPKGGQTLVVVGVPFNPPSLHFVLRSGGKRTSLGLDSTDVDYHYNAISPCLNDKPLEDFYLIDNIIVSDKEFFSKVLSIINETHWPNKGRHRILPVKEVVTEVLKGMDEFPPPQFIPCLLPTCRNELLAMVLERLTTLTDER